MNIKIPAGISNVADAAKFLKVTPLHVRRMLRAVTPEHVKYAGWTTEEIVAGLEIILENKE